jgi:DNA-binding beta-propeller fold protein YncE
MASAIAVGNAPQGLAITPNGNRLYVANSGSNTVTPPIRWTTRST